MDTRFRTSFVPKKTLIPKDVVTSGSAVHLLLASGAIVFLMVLAVFAGVYLYRALLNKTINEQSLALEKAKKAFETSFIVDAKRFDRRINGANSILKRHQIITPVFSLLSELTLQTVRYNSLIYTNASGVPSLSLSGEAKGYASVALQSDAFLESEKIRNPLFTDVVNVNKDASKSGVSFKFTGTLEPATVSYEKTVISDKPSAIQHEADPST